ncbi:Lrp/AsnC family transcriptional regulator [Rhodoferax antarcticus]|uniref:Transcriptional regulator asnC family protein n=1 Tax=Rhodoferax antarcticus ANT.BR TaxID=1111071 RepID=A0A1Q8YCZ1_9BURK|nr:Lrp/AsnC family transcriptional regulator [Rhodoferax antarcticus]APW45831.1 AsnC family transcriptional regulator [Rhodoferax antarcticus]MCW2310668.1 Lrp/AsnC family leucine-responsive transcriptional regulator [Rhodoferax antarcticus]OLP05916.1 transcriptional regulator asnC family protein [Rhodoferax antarcticus ANT.BR]
MNKTVIDDSLLDKFDIALLAALQQDASATHQQLGEAVHLSPSQVSRRVARLQASGIIRRTVALLDPARIGLGVRAICYVTLARHGDVEGIAFEREIAGFAEVLECFAVTGESDYILQIVAASLQDLSESVLRRLARIKVVHSVRSNIVLQSIKSSTVLPLAQIER